MSVRRSYRSNTLLVCSTPVRVAATDDADENRIVLLVHDVVSKVQMLPGTVALFSSTLPVSRLFEANFGRPGRMMLVDPMAAAIENEIAQGIRPKHNPADHAAIINPL
jgi:hypothetical protein